MKNKRTVLYNLIVMLAGVIKKPLLPLKMQPSEVISIADNFRWNYAVKRKSYTENVSPDSTLVIKIKLSKVVRK